MERKLKQDQRKMADYQIDNKVLYAGAGGTEAMVADIGLLKSNMVESELKRDQIRLLISRLNRNEGFDTAIIDSFLISGIISDSSGLNVLQTRINSEKAILSSLKAKYTDGHPSVMASKEAIAEMEKSLLIQAYNALNEVYINYSESADTAENKFDAIVEELPENEMNLAILEKDIITDMQILGALYTEYEIVKLTKLKEEAKTGKIRIIEKPHIPSTPVFPDKKKNALVTAVILSFFGLTWAFINHFLDFTPLYEKIPFFKPVNDFISKVKSKFARK